MLQELTIVTFMTMLLSASTYSEQSCTPKRLYCGSQIPGLLPRVQNTTLWQCGSDGKSLNISYICDNGCKTVLENDSYCLCKANRRYCGFELMDMGGWRGYENHSIYKCDDEGLNTRIIETCPQQCKVASQSYCSGQCQDGQLYCGYRLTMKELDWDRENDTLYQCRGGNETSIWSKCSPGMCYSHYCKCNPGQYYCGHELFVQLGWTNFKSSQRELSKCAPTGSSVFDMYDCDTGTTCYKTENSSKCGCDSDYHYCGHELLKRGWDGYDNNTLYQCDGGYNAKYMKTCQVKCTESRRYSFCGGECVQGTKYCGSKINQRGYKGYRNDSIYLCENNLSLIDTGETNVLCGQGCTAGRSYCGYEVQYIWGTAKDNLQARYICNKDNSLQFTAQCTTCINDGNRAYCHCVPGSTLCGYKLHTMGHDGYENQSLYLCEGGNGLMITKLMSCGDGKCKAGDFCGDGKCKTGDFCECFRDKLYCGHQLYKMGWRNISLTSQTALGRCTNGSNVEWIALCNQCNNTETALSGDPRPTCECKTGSTYCGYTLHAMGYDGYYEDETLYLCKEGENGSYINKLVDCGEGKCSIGACNCIHDKLYCSHELYQLGWGYYALFPWGQGLLGRCINGRNVKWISKCENCNNTGTGSKCECRPFNLYCGHDLLIDGWDGLDNDTVYQCDDGRVKVRIWLKCHPGTCHSGHCKCNPGRYYCGHELFEQLGWTDYEFKQQELFKCAPNGTEIWIEDCHQCNKNTGTALMVSGDQRPTCECKTGYTYCGYTLQEMGWGGYETDTLYLCVGGQNGSYISKLMACGEGKCKIAGCDCTRNKLYCGHELYQMGWRHLTSSGEQAQLGRCTNGTNVIWIASCNNCHKTGTGSKCECSSGNHYCGHQLFEWGWGGYDNETLYHCDGSLNVKKTKTCHGECITENTHSSCGGECAQGTKYCGSKLNKMGYQGYNDDDIYLCQDSLSPLIATGETNALCSQGCLGSSSYCGYQVQYVMDVPKESLHRRYICDDENKSFLFGGPCTTCISDGGRAYCHCIPGWRYCASTLYTIGWIIFGGTINVPRNFTNDTIFRCKDEKNVEYVETCATNECQNRESASAHCLCSANRTYCGHELYEHYNSMDTYLYPHYIYRCSRTRLSVIEQEQCANCYRLAGTPTCRQECSVGQYYCGSDLLLLEGWKKSDTQPNWLNRCDNSTTAQPIAECIAGCMSNSSISGQDATCNPSSTAWYWFFGGVSVPLVIIGLGFLLIRIFLKHRRLKKFLEEQRIDVSQLITIKMLGEGEFGEVWQGTYRNTDGILRDVALKLSKEKTDTASKLACANCFLQEVVSLDIVSHRNIIKVYGICLNFRFKDQCGNTVPALVLEFMNGGSAISYMRSERNRLTGRDLLHIFLDICQAGDHLCKLGIIHRDIGARNVLVQKDPHTGHVIVAKLTDFGLAKDIGKLTNMYKAANLDQNMFHFRYTAPEGFHGCFSSKSDVWSFGVFMWELYTVMEEQDALADLRLEQGRSGPVPYFSLDTVADVFTEACSDRTLKQPRMTPENLYKIMRQCWETQEDLRPSFEELIKFFNTNYDGNVIQEATAMDVSHKNSDSKNGHSEIQEEHNAIPHGYVRGPP